MEATDPSCRRTRIYTLLGYITFCADESLEEISDATFEKALENVSSFRFFKG
jgi:hypothetical protein